MIAQILGLIAVQTLAVHLVSQGKQSAAEARMLILYVQMAQLVFYPQTAINAIFNLFNFQAFRVFLSSRGE